MPGSTRSRSSQMCPAYFPLSKYRSSFLDDIAHHEIRIFQAPPYEDEDEEILAETEKITVRIRSPLQDISLIFSLSDPVHKTDQSKVPFSTVGANSVINTLDGRQVRARQYPQDIAEVENELHCDFVKLRQMIHTHMEELREHTNEFFIKNTEAEALGLGRSSRSRCLLGNRVD